MSLHWDTVRGVGACRGALFGAIVPVAFGRAVDEGHAIIHADATVHGDTGTVNRGETVVALEFNVATHAGDLAKVNGSEVVVVEADEVTHTGDLAKVYGGEVVVVETDVLAHAGDPAKVDGSEVVEVKVNSSTHAGDPAKVDGSEVVVVDVDSAWKPALPRPKTELIQTPVVHVNVIASKVDMCLRVSRLNERLYVLPLT